MIAVVAIATAWVAVALGQLNDLLAAMHVAGSPSFTISALAGGPDDAANVLRVWTAHAAEAVPPFGDETPPPDARAIAGLLGLLDSVLLVPLYVLLGVLFFRRARLGSTSGLHELPAIGTVAVVIAGVLDLVENFAQTRVVGAWWNAEPIDRPDAIHTWARVLHWFALGKWVFAGLAVLCAALIGWGLLTDLYHAHKHRSRNAARQGRRVGFQVGAIVGAIVLFNQQGQVADLYRRWQAWQAVLSLIFLAFAGFAAWAVTRRLLVRGTCPPCRPAHVRTVKRAIFLGLWALAALQFVFHRRFDDAQFDPGWGLLVPAIMVMVLAILGLGVRRESTTTPGPEPAPATDPTPDREPVLPRLLATGLVIGFAFALLRASFGYAIYTRQWAWGQAVGLLAIAAGGAIVGLLLQRLAPPLPADRDNLARRVLREPVSWAVTGTLVGLVVIGPRGGSKDIAPVLLIVLSLLLVVGALRWFVAMGRERMPDVQLDLKLAAGAVAVGLVVPAAIAFFALGTGQALSVPGVAAAFLAAFLLGAGLIAWGASWIPLPRALRRLETFPATVFLLLWFAAASQFDHDGAFHNARVREASAPAVAVTAQEQLACWLGRRGVATPTGASTPGDRDCDPPPDAASSDRPVPLIVVASTGGGIRSAYWTASVLDCAFELRAAPSGAEAPCPEADRSADFSRSDGLFALSGISGGSVGIAEYATHLNAKERDALRPGWVQQALEVDGLSPSGARWLFVEIPRVFFQFDGPDDRAAILEQAFEARWDGGELGGGLFRLSRESRHAPLLLLNSTSVSDGCRFNVSALDGSVEPTDSNVRPTCRSSAPFDEPRTATGAPLSRDPRVPDTSVLPATRDLGDLLCGEKIDLRLSTAALLSARFPYVNPAGRVASRCPETHPGTVHGVDGGYLDTSGASPLVELMTALWPTLDAVNADSRNAGRCVIPFMIQIDNGFDDTSPPRSTRRPAELGAPLATVFAARLARAAEARTAAALMFTRPFAAARFEGKAVSNRYAHFVNEAHPGPGAPFGWAQSRFSQKELVGQLAQPRNLAALDEVRDWFAAIADGRLTCAR